jgi:hypothetical protein
MKTNVNEMTRGNIKGAFSLGLINRAILVLKSIKTAGKK